jgi:hypothetical protein
MAQTLEPEDPFGVGVEDRQRGHADSLRRLGLR